MNIVKRLIQPISPQKDKARREYILNILLTCSLGLSLVAAAITFIEDTVLKMSRSGNTPLPLLIIPVLYLAGLWLSKKGKSKLVACILVGLYFLLASQALYKWGPDMPVGLLMYALLIVMAGILINANFSFLLVTVISGYLAILIYLYMHNTIHFEQGWKKDAVEVVDAIIFSLLFLIIATVSWLFNRESEKALKRARISELALKKERDLLEQKVEEKTRKLKQTQIEKIAQIYRFAEIGKMAFGFMHDLSNAVSLVSMNVQALKEVHKDQSLLAVQDMLERANIGTKRLENYVLAARKQINNQQTKELFLLTEEINQVIEILQYQAKIRSIVIIFTHQENIQLMGNPIKFYQLVTNLLLNAIESYADSRKKHKTIEIQLHKKGKVVTLEIKDRGVGISQKNITAVFTPLFTTKEKSHGSGMGLSLSRDIIMKDFGGTISVASKSGYGTTFRIDLPN